jgi:DNA-binding response OmpR family regulator
MPVKQIRATSAKVGAMVAPNGVAVRVNLKITGAGRTVTKTMILEHVWDYSFDPQTNVVDVVMSRLRAKIDPDHRRIETVRGVGYIFRAHGHA